MKRLIVVLLLILLLVSCAPPGSSSVQSGGSYASCYVDGNVAFKGEIKYYNYGSGYIKVVAESGTYVILSGYCLFEE